MIKTNNKHAFLLTPHGIAVANHWYVYIYAHVCMYMYVYLLEMLLCLKP